MPVIKVRENEPFGAYPTDGSEAFTFLRNILPGIGGLLYKAAAFAVKFRTILK